MAKSFKMNTSISFAPRQLLRGHLRRAIESQSSDDYARVLLIVLLAVSAASPDRLFTSYPDGPSTMVWKGIFGLGATCLAVMGWRRYCGLSIVRAFLPFVAWSIVCWANSGFPTDGLKSLASTIIPLVFAFGVESNSAKINVQLVRRGLGAGLILALAGAFVLFAMGFQPMPGTGALAEFGQFDRFMGIGWGYPAATCAVPFIAIICASHVVQPRWRNYSLIIFGFLIPALCLLRTILLGAITVVLLSSTTIIRRYILDMVSIRRFCSRRAQRTTHLVGSAIGLLTCLVAVLLAFLPLIMEKTFTVDGALNTSGRLETWPVWLKTIESKPILGVGPRGDALICDIEGLGAFAAPHNEYLMLATCYGLPGLVLYIGAWATVLARLWRWRPVSREDAICRLTAMYTVMALLTIMLAENILRHPTVMTQFIVLPALAIAHAQRSLTGNRV